MADDKQVGKGDFIFANEVRRLFKKVAIKLVFSWELTLYQFILTNNVLRHIVRTTGDNGTLFPTRRKLRKE